MPKPTIAGYHAPEEISVAGLTVALRRFHVQPYQKKSFSGAIGMWRKKGAVDAYA